MASKIDIELTSMVDDEYWTWRAAGARNPRGTVASSIVYAGARIGDVAKAEVVVGIDGIEIVSLHAPQVPETPSNVIQVVGKQHDEPPVTTSHAGRKPRGGRKDAGNREPRPSAHRSQQREPRAPRGAPTPKVEPKKLRPGDANRRAAIEQLLPEHKPIGEQLLRGGMPAVRAAILAENEREKEGNLPLTPIDATLRIAEAILPKIRVATWLDRAEAAKPIAQEISLKDLRSVVAAADRSAKDQRATELTAELSGVLEARSTAETSKWLGEIGAALDGNRLIRALRLASRLPDPASKLTQEVLERLTGAASAEMNAETAAERWMVLIDAVAQSPVRRLVKPGSFPPGAPPELVEFAKESAGRIPALAELLGVTVPPPPKPEIMAKIPRTSRRPAPKAPDAAPD